MDSPSTEGGQLPPTLPAKQRRSVYSRSSSTSSLDTNSRASSSMAFASPPLLSPTMHHGSFSLPSSPSCDCFAPQCPIHHRYGPSDSHQERYYSEKTPPPIPKKRLARTMSLPGEFPSSSYLHPPPLPQFNNPLYTLSPQEDAVFDPASDSEDGAETGAVVGARAAGPPKPSVLPLHFPPPHPLTLHLPLSLRPSPAAPSLPRSPLPLPQLAFDTPDDLLPLFFSDLGDRAQVSDSLQQRLLLFLRSTAERVEKGARGVAEERVRQVDEGVQRAEERGVTRVEKRAHRVRERVWWIEKGIQQVVEEEEEGEEEEEEEIRPQDMLLCRGEPISDTQGGVLHHRVRCTRQQGREFSIQISRESSTPIPSLQHPHPNVQQVIAHFPASPDAIIHSAEQKGGVMAAVWPQGGSRDEEMWQESTAAHSDERGIQRHSQTQREHTTVQPTVQSLLNQGYSVTVSRDLTQATLEEFVMEEEGRGGSLSRTQPQVYQRRLLLLLLQVTQALQHLKTHGIQVTALEPRYILLAWREDGGAGHSGRGGSREEEELKLSRGSQGGDERRRMGNCHREELGAARRKPEEEQQEEEEEGGRERRGRAEGLWRRWGTPRVVLTLCTSTTASFQPITSHHVQLGKLLQRCLQSLVPDTTASSTMSPRKADCLHYHGPPKLASPDSTAPPKPVSSNAQAPPKPNSPYARAPAAPPDTPYSQGLACLLSQLLVPECGVQLSDVAPMLQALLWGPRASLFQHAPSTSTSTSTDPVTTTVHNWLQVKRSLLLLKLAERGLFSDQSVVDWEDYLCLQYLSLTDPHTVLSATAKLGLHCMEL